MDTTVPSFHPRSLSRSLAHYARPSGPDLMARGEGFFVWQDGRRKDGLWPYTKCLQSAPGPECGLREDRGVSAEGVNFATQDYLSLSTHPSVIEAAVAAAREFGVHSAGSPCLAGNTRNSLALEAALAELLESDHVVLFPTGWAAGFGVIKVLVQPGDHVVLDRLCHNCLQEGARAATPNVHLFEHNVLDDLRAKLHAVRTGDADCGILVVTESLFSMDSDSPDLRAVQAVCREYQATLLVDVAHDLGATGPGGGGVLVRQGVLGQVDLVMGSFSKTFASNGGFLATKSRTVKEYVSCYSNPRSFSNALSPVQAAVVKRCIEIVRSPEGERLRCRLAENVGKLRAGFAGRGIACLGDPSPIVPVPVGGEKVGRVASRLLFDRGVFANLVEFPAVAVGASRFRMQVMAAHEPQHVAAAVGVVADAIRDARTLIET